MEFFLGRECEDLCVTSSCFHSASTGSRFLYLPGRNEQRSPSSLGFVYLFTLCLTAE